MAKLHNGEAGKQNFGFKSSKLKCRSRGDLEYFATDSGFSQRIEFLKRRLSTTRRGLAERQEGIFSPLRLKRHSDANVNDKGSEICELDNYQ